MYNELLNWFYLNKRNLPWRHGRSPYRVWVSEIMLQQTQVKTVIPYYKKWIKKYPTLKSFKESSLDDVIKLWEGLGYYSRCQNMFNAAKLIKSSLPSNYEELIKLPGIGDYTAKTILAIAFKKNSVGVDTNLERIGYRILGLKTKTKRNQKRVIRFLEENQCPKNPGDYNEALMDLGSSLCKSNITHCNECPLKSICKAYAYSSPTSYPSPKASKKIPIYDIAISVIEYENKVLITKRQNTKFLSGLWEFPGGKIEKHETAVQAIVREVKEETNLTISNPLFLGNISHKYSHFGVNISLFISFPKSITSLNLSQEYQWIRMKDILNYPLPKANHKMLDILKKLD
jgi:A/G-specific adenine glycosylase